MKIPSGSLDLIQDLGRYRSRLSPDPVDRLHADPHSQLNLWLPAQDLLRQAVIREQAPHLALFRAQAFVI